MEDLEGDGSCKMPGQDLTYQIHEVNIIPPWLLIPTYGLGDE
jgi:hypothetical protein